MRRSLENAETIGLFFPHRQRGRSNIRHNTRSYTRPSIANHRFGGSGRAERRGRGIYLPPARVTTQAQAPTHIMAPARPRAPMTPYYTPPTSPQRQNMDPRSTVLLDSPEDAFTNMNVIRDARRRNRAAFYCETYQHIHVTLSFANVY